ncbi:MAG: hypothetical protein ORO03_03625 [Alphaproteobacteria bacterium]|nr:hypothetical protein [Alphaproteobacteria bacterium]
MLRCNPIVQYSCLLMVTLGLTSCGLHPIYSKRSLAPNGTNSGRVSIVTELGKITVEPIENRSGQLLRTMLEKQFAAARAKSGEIFTDGDLGYGLVVTVTSSPSYQGAQIDRSTNYGVLIFQIQYKLLNLNNRSVVFNSSFTIQRNFTLPRDGFAESISINDAQKLGMTQIAQTIIENLNSYFFQLAEK